MSGALTPYLSNSFFIQSREREYRIEITLSRGATCVVLGECSNWRERIAMWWFALRLKIADKIWESTEREYFECFELWKRGDEILEEYIADNPNEYWSISVQEAVGNRNKTLRKLIFLGEMMLDFPGISNSSRHRNPFVDCVRIKSIVTILRNDLEDEPTAYFKSLIESEENDEQQGNLGFNQRCLQQEV